MDERPDVVIADPRGIRALAHPARLVAVRELFGAPERALTATRLAAAAGLTPSAMSYHLRALERWGVLERGEAGPDGRERPWRAAGPRLRVEGSDAGSRVASQALVGTLLDEVAAELSTLPGDAEGDDAWRGVGGLQRGSAQLTGDEARELAAEVDALADRYLRRAEGREPGPTTRLVSLTWALAHRPGAAPGEAPGRSGGGAPTRASRRPPQPRR